jgi:hypothetical protein
MGFARSSTLRSRPGRRARTGCQDQCGSRSLRPCCWAELRLRRQKPEGPRALQSFSIPASTRPRSGPTVAILTIAYLMRTMVIPIHSKAYSTSMLCHLSVPVTITGAINGLNGYGLRNSFGSLAIFTAALTVLFTSSVSSAAHPIPICRSVSCSGQRRA